MNEKGMLNLVEYPKANFLKDVEKWIKTKDLKFILTEDLGEFSELSIKVDGSSFEISEENDLYIWQNGFSLELNDGDYDVYLDDDAIREDGTRLYQYPCYYLVYKNRDTSWYTTIEII